MYFDTEEESLKISQGNCDKRQMQNVLLWKKLTQFKQVKGTEKQDEEKETALP